VAGDFGWRLGGLAGDFSKVDFFAQNGKNLVYF
jgi:hypothetical protein